MIATTVNRKWIKDKRADNKSDAEIVKELGAEAATLSTEEYEQKWKDLEDAGIIGNEKGKKSKS